MAGRAAQPRFVHKGVRVLAHRLIDVIDSEEVSLEPWRLRGVMAALERPVRVCVTAHAARQLCADPAERAWQQRALLWTLLGLPVDGA